MCALPFAWDCLITKDFTKIASNAASQRTVVNYTPSRLHAGTGVMPEARDGCAGFKLLGQRARCSKLLRLRAK
jgi:hypothetical protein